MELWIARNVEGWLGLYKTKPVFEISKYRGGWIGNFMGYVNNDLDVNKTILPEVTPANSPKKVELKLVVE